MKVSFDVEIIAEIIMFIVALAAMYLFFLRDSF